MASLQIRFGFLFIVVLVALRLSVGWHFFKEGAKKIDSGNFTSKNFLQQAKGPLAVFFHAQIPDYRGEQRLNKNAIAARWKEFNDDVVSRLKFTDEQKRRAAIVLNKHRVALDGYFAEWGEDINTYLAEWKRLDAARASPARVLDYEADRINNKQAELWNKPNSWYADLKTLEDAYQSEVVSLATPDQQVTRVKRLPDLSVSWVDTFVTYLTFGVGVLLVLGLFTRLAALAGAGFLASVMATQPFWVYGADLTYSYYQVVELIAMLLLAVTAAGRFAGLDYFVHAMRMRCCPPNKGIGDEFDT